MRSRQMFGSGAPSLPRLADLATAHVGLGTGTRSNLGHSSERKRLDAEV